MQFTTISQSTQQAMEALGTMGFSMSMLIGYAIAVLPMWFIFKKAGIEGWKAIIPFYNGYLMYKLAWGTKWFWYTIVAGLIIGVCSEALGGGANFLIQSFAAIVTGVVCVLAVLIEIFYSIKLSKSFGHGGLFALGLIFLTLIFEYILAFDSHKYIGPAGVKVKAVKAKKK